MPTKALNGDECQTLARLFSSHLLPYQPPSLVPNLMLDVIHLLASDQHDIRIRSSTKLSLNPFISPTTRKPPQPNAPPPHAKHEASQALHSHTRQN